MDDCALKPQIPAGEYVAEFDHYYTTTMFRERSAKLCMVFYIVDGEYAGMPIERFHTVAKLYGEHGKDGQFKPKGQTCKLMMEYCRCFPDQQITRLDRIPMSRWNEGKFIVAIRAVSKNHEREELPGQLRYSVIDRIITPHETNPAWMQPKS